MTTANRNGYLKPNVQVDPLFNQWYAWILLIPPATAALNTLERHLKIMKSYVNSPAMHAAAVRNPAMQKADRRHPVPVSTAHRLCRCDWAAQQTAAG
jgi:hypothetical protein